MSYQSEVLANTGFQTNIVIEIDGTYFGKHQPDSGLVIDSDKLLLSTGSINPSQVNLRRATTTTSNVTLKVLDKNGVFSTFLGADDNALTGLELNLYVGRITGSFDWADYELIKTYIIRDISKSAGFYTLRAVSPTDQMNDGTFNVFGNLNTAINDNDSTIIIDTETDIFSSYTALIIDSEFISYDVGNLTFDAGNEQTTITSVTRSQFSSTAVAHSAGTECYPVYSVSENPVDIILKLWISNGGGGIYDTYPDGIGISNSLVDITAIEGIRDTFHSGETFELRFYNVSNTLKYIQDHFPYLSWAPIIFTSATEKQRTKKILDLVLEVKAEQKKEIDPSTLQKFIEQAVKKHRPTKGKGTKYPKVYGLKQTGIEPPTFSLAVNLKSDLHFSYLRYIENRLRERFGFMGTPIKINVKRVSV